MSLYAGTLGQLVIVEVFVFWIWLKVFLETVKRGDNVTILAHRKLLLTSLGLVFNAIAIIGIMGVRIKQLVDESWPFVWSLVAFYVILAIGNFLFIVSASIGSNLKLLKWFIAATMAWTAIVVYSVM